MMKEQNSQIKFIILSGFATFEYARQAIACNVTNYLLKPIDTDELIRSITEIRETLDKNNHLKQERLAWQEARLIAEHAEKSTFFPEHLLRPCLRLRERPVKRIRSASRRPLHRYRLRRPAQGYSQPLLPGARRLSDSTGQPLRLPSVRQIRLHPGDGCLQPSGPYPAAGAAARRTGSFSGTLILRCPGEFFQRHRVRLRIW